MKILHSTSDWLGLTKSWIYDQIRFMPREVEQSIWCYTRINGPHETWKGNIFIEQPSLYNLLCRITNSTLSLSLLQCKSHISFEDYDVLFSHFGNRAWHDYMYIKGLPIKKVVRFYGCDIGLTPKQSGWMKKYAQIFNEYDMFLCEGPYMARQLEYLGAPKEKIKWQYLGIDPDLISTLLFPTEQLIDPLCILIAGTFTEKKGIEYALQGIIQFVQHTKHKVRVTLIGDSGPVLNKENSRKEAIENLCKIMATNETVELIRKGYVPLTELYSLMKENLIFLSPSVTAQNGDIEGGFPVTLTHAAANGMILIGTDHCDLPEIVRDRVNGYVCNQRSAESIRNSLCDVIQTNATSLTAMRNASLGICSAHFNASDIGNYLYNLIIKNS